MSPAKLPKLAEGVEVNCTTKGSGVGLADWPSENENAPQASVNAAIAQKTRKAGFTKSSANKDAETSRLDALGESGPQAKRR
jgi:hypothetical protein